MNLNKLRGFAFLGTPIDVQCELPFTLGPGILLTRATVSQRRRIKRHLRSLGGHLYNTEPFECQFTDKQHPSPHPRFEIVEHNTKRLPSPAWRYYVVQLKDFTLNLKDAGCTNLTLLRACSHMTVHPLRLSPLFAIHQIFSPDFTSDIEYFTNIAITGEDPIIIDGKYLEDLEYCYTAVHRVSSSHPEITHSIRLYCDLPDRVGYNELTTLGLFAVLESLLTHNPRGDADSISQQIRKKLTLVEKRLPSQFDYSRFGPAPHDTIWNKLYELRSRIAHGTPLDFDRALVLLVGTFEVEQFLRRALPILLRAALEEPDLFVDLKAV